MSSVFTPARGGRIQIYKPQKIINYASVKKRSRLHPINVASYEALDMKSLQSNALLMKALPDHHWTAIVSVVIIISVTVKKDST